MHNNPRVSVIIPAYSRPHYVQLTIRYVLEQSYRDIELIVIDDSTNGQTQQALAPLAREGSIRYVRQRNQGVAAARNHGLQVARGDYIAYLDDDDLWPAGRL